MFFLSPLQVELLRVRPSPEVFFYPQSHSYRLGIVDKDLAVRSYENSDASQSYQRSDSPIGSSIQLWRFEQWSRKYSPTKKRRVPLWSSPMPGVLYSPPTQRKGLLFLVKYEGKITMVNNLAQLGGWHHHLVPKAFLLVLTRLQYALWRYSFLSLFAFPFMLFPPV